MNTTIKLRNSVSIFVWNNIQQCLAHEKTLFWSIHSLQLFKVFSGIADVDQSSCRRNGWIRHHDHDVSVGCEYVNESSKVRVPHFHTLERGSQLATAQLELLNNVADFLKSVGISLFFTLIMRNHQKGSSFKQKNFISLNNFSKIPQVHFQLLNIGNQLINNAGPCLIQSFIPDRCSETRTF